VHGDVLSLLADLDRRARRHQLAVEREAEALALYERKCDIVSPVLIRERS
jgi:hypothetical protein